VGQAADIAIHENPVWRDRANHILQADLGGYGLAGRFEQLWARDLRNGTYELCCLPFFTYGFALGDVVRLEPSKGRFADVLGSLVSRSERDLLRVAFRDRGAMQAQHEELHAVLAASGRPHEWHRGGLVSVDVEGTVPDAIRQTVNRLAVDGDVQWEWARSIRPGEVAAR
jgi:hypothetical protein